MSSKAGIAGNIVKILIQINIVKILIQIGFAGSLLGDIRHYEVKVGCISPFGQY